ncbi:N-acetylmuramoyl-L-alanine amidase [Streptomyces flaveolus]|uniref:N-acetylmuramoyl-L-alanine amidase n=1 Tax=Streptomyces flaveolus TaxID=67297 RepID=UPI0033D6DAC0
MSTLFSTHPHTEGDGHVPGMQRRRFLAGLGAVAAVPALGACGPDYIGAAASSPSAKPKPGKGDVPRTHVSQTPSPGRSVQRTSFPMTALGISWTGPQRGVKIRLYDKEGNPGNWQPVNAGCPCGADPSDSKPAPAAAVSRALVPANGSFGYQVDAASGIHVVNAIAIDSGLFPVLNEPEAAPSSPSASPSSSPTADSPSASPSSSPTADSPSASPSPTATTTRTPVQDFPPTGLITRKQWGADESKRFKADGTENSPARFFPVQALTVHHTVTANNDPDPAATVRAIYEQHAIANDWGDIGYHFLIDGNGRIYEGRFSGDDGVPAHDKQGRVVTGFHTVGFNSGNIGVALLGDFDKGEQTPAMRDSLARLLASLAKKHNLDVQADITYRNPVNDKTKQAPTLAGHRDWISTECPGTSTYASLDALREQVAGILAD